MKNFAAKSLQALQHAYRILYNRLAGHPRCPACGFRGEFITRPVLWPELISEWELSSEWAHWIDQREGTACPRCASNLRSGQHARAILDAVKILTGVTATCLASACEDPSVAALSVAEINSAGAMHQFLAKIPNLRYSEFGSKCAEIPSEDLMCLSYADSSFDLVITSETLEHVPNVDVALREIHRILKPAGLHVFTVPIVWDRPQTRQRAYLNDGQLVHALPPSFHGAPQDGRMDYLVFYEFGTDFVERCRQSGFEVNLMRDKKNPSLVTFIAHKKG